jgi:hypothetical protein
MMTNYPVMFTFQDTVSGNGFLSGIEIHGRAIMTREDDGKWWMYGVHPGGMAHFGDSVMEAYSKFRESYKTVLFDIAEEASNFETFKAEVQTFYWECGPEEEQRWECALEALRSGTVTPEAPFSTFPRLTPEERACGIEVKRLDQVASSNFSSKNNVTDTLALPIAA